jgi:DnaA family protein
VKQLALDFSVAVEPTLDNFAVGRNAELVQHLRALVLSRTSERVLYLWGAPGSGRTHLIKAALAAFGVAGAPVRYVRCERSTSFSNAFDDAGAVGVDDVELLSESGQVGLFNLYNTLLERRAALLVSGDAPPSSLSLRPDLVTRLAAGLVYEVHGLNDAEKAHALAEHAALRGFTLAPEVCDYVLTHVPRDMAVLLALVDTLDRQSLEQQRPVTVPMVRAVLARQQDVQ